MKDKNSQLEERVMSNIRAVTNIPPNTVTSLSEEYIRTAVANIVHMCESYAATREAEGRKQGALKLWAKISVAVGLWLPAFNSKPEEAKAAKELIRVMTHEWDDYLKALTDTQGEEKPPRVGE